MGRAYTLRQKRKRHLIECMVCIAVIFLLMSVGVAQTTGAGAAEGVLTDELNKYPGLLPEFGQLIEKMQHDVQFPPARSQSHLLPLLPHATVFYGAFPNFGEASHQVLTIFQKELQQSPPLRVWWQHGEWGTAGPKVEDSLEKFYQFSQFLGDEIVVSGTINGHKDPEILVLADARKPGLKDFLQQMSKELAGKSTLPVRVVNVRELATAKTGPPQEPVILVRPDFVVGAGDIATLRSFNAQTERNSKEFATTEFGQRLAQAYQGGTTAVGGIDLQKIVSEVPRGADQNWMVFQRTGFSDVKYLVWEHRDMGGQAASQMELSFTGPRHGVASWLAAPGPMGSLDFVSPKAAVAVSVLLKNPGQIFDDVKDLATASNPQAFAFIAQMEAGLGLSLRDDLLGQLGGEITLELDSLTQTDPKWKAILRVKDPARLQTTLSTLLAQTPLNAQRTEEDGVSYHTLRIPSANKVTEIGYAFVDGYLIIGSGRESVVEAVRLHRSGEPLAKSQKFLAALPPGHGAEASGLFYEDPMAMMALSMRQALPDMAEALSKAASETSPSVACAYGEESVIREVSRSRGVDAGTVLVMAAIAIPNLLRARIAANESSAVGMIRTVNVAQITYSSTYPQEGFARDLATLGPNPQQATIYSADHAGLIDATLGKASCTGGTWCEKSGFQFSVSAVCKKPKQRCEEYVVVGTPVSMSTGTRSFCSISDGVVRYKGNTLLTSPVSVSECQTWSPRR